MTAITVTDRDRLRAYFSREPALHVYELGDLDDLFWPHTRWYGHEADGELRAVVLVYTASELPVVLAIGDVEPLAGVLAEIRDLLPPRLYAHLSPGLVSALGPDYADNPRGDYRKMALVDRDRLAAADIGAAARLGPDDRVELEAFYVRAYPGNWFDSRVLATGQYMAIREDGRPIAVAGVHVFSRAERVAALGNVAVAPDRRGAGLGSQVTAATCRSLLAAGVDQIGLNVHTDNGAAIACYERLGFTTVGRYEEHLMIVRR